MTRGRFYSFMVSLFLLAGLGCSQPSTGVLELKHYPINSPDDVISTSDLEIDRTVTSDGNGSLRITVAEPTVIKLFETGDLDVDSASLIYQARIMTKGVDGQVYLEMWCRFPGKGEFFSRALHSPLKGNTDWTTQETPFFLKKGENPDNVKLNLVIDGRGTVWIDDVRLIKAPLN